MRLSLSEKILIQELKYLKVGMDSIIKIMMKVNSFEKADDFSDYLASHSNLNVQDMIGYASTL